METNEKRLGKGMIIHI